MYVPLILWVAVPFLNVTQLQDSLFMGIWCIELNYYLCETIHTSTIKLYFPYLVILNLGMILKANNGRTTYLSI